MRFEFEGSVIESLIRYCDVNGNFRLYFALSIFAPPKIDEKGGKESELAWMSLAGIVSASCVHPALRQRILWGLGWQAVLRLKFNL